MSGRIVVVGSCNVDLIAHVPALPRPGETVIGETLVQDFGGKGANQAVAARRLGGDVHLVARVGADSFGDAYLEALRREGIGTSRVGRASAATGVALVTVGADGRNTIVVVPGANATLTPADVEAARPLIAGAAVVLGQLEVPQPATAAALELARTYGAVTVLTPAPAQPLDPRLLATTDFLVPNEPELAALSGRQAGSPEAAEAAARLLMERFGGEVIATLGSRGALRVTRGAAVLTPPPAVEPVDTTGAGDAFVGAFAYGLAAGFDVNTAIRRAVVVAAVSVTRRGTQGSFPAAGDRQLEALLAAHL